MAEAEATLVANDSETLLRRDVRDMLSEKYFTLSLPTTVFQILMSALGIFGNTVLLLICWRRKMHNSAMFYIGSLAVVDLFACVIVIPLQIVHSWRYYTYYDDIACKAFQWFKLSTLASSCLLFMGIAVDRYKAVCHPFTWRQSDKKRAFVIPCVCILAGVTCMAPELVLVGIQEYSVNQTILRFHFSEEEKATMDFSQSANICEHLNSFSGSWELTTFLSVALAIFIILVAVAIVCYGRITWTMHQNRKQFTETLNNNENRQSTVPLRQKPRGALSRTASDDIAESALSDMMDKKHSSTSEDGRQRDNIVQKQVTVSLDTKNTNNTLQDPRTSSNESQSRKSSLANESRKGSMDMASISKKQYDVARALMVVTIVFLLSWLPYWIIAVYGVIYDDYHITLSTELTALLVFVEQLFFLNNAVNPLVYLMYSGEFRQQCKQLFRKGLRASRSESH